MALCCRVSLLIIQIKQTSSTAEKNDEKKEKKNTGYYIKTGEWNELPTMKR